MSHSFIQNCCWITVRVSHSHHAPPLITGAGRCDTLSPVLRQLHWLPIRQRVQFKLAVLGFKALQCLTDDCQLVAAAGRRQLRSSDAVTCLVEHSDSRFESIHRFVLSESIRIDSFCKKIGLSIH